ncbi:hypothetical protein DLJ48_05165 [Oenococcus sicerae]|uniref:Uncharacterized protein n=1 Tax=Oenococcus sicerae TaxID=2203724 RepID=A0AAJ1VNM7_9LACO|nr:hypothetical protein [Oenococcus sicerae]MDN6900379.1 hypothetical protein [Oenococcus sicerae]QAS69956.1 hypothetical protein DLJ48_05165 [Oenococcus sicerae]VDK13459.1 hypothetical protein OAL24_00258 [Oenococcus sicerae]
MYDDKPLLLLFLLFKKIFITVIAMSIAMVLMLDEIERFPLTQINQTIINAAIYLAITVALLNVFQTICLFIYLNRPFRIIYLFSSYFSNAALIAVSVIRITAYPYMYLGVFAGSLGLAMLTYQVRQNRQYYFEVEL